MKKKALTVEFNEKFKKENTEVITPSGGIISFTPSINKDYWAFRVKLHKDQSIVAFPKCFTLGVGFAQESNWNTNLPYTTETETLYNHIKENKKYKAITKEKCIEAINLIKEVCEKNISLFS